METNPENAQAISSGLIEQAPASANSEVLTIDQSNPDNHVRHRDSRWTSVSSDAADRVQTRDHFAEPLRHRSTVHRRHGRIGSSVVLIRSAARRLCVACRCCNSCVQPTGSLVETLGCTVDNVLPSVDR